jgi:hypothetical protein
VIKNSGFLPKVKFSKEDAKMALKADTFYNPPRLVGDDTSENVTLSVGQLANFPGGAWLLGGDDTVTGSSSVELILGIAFLAMMATIHFTAAKATIRW